MRVLSPRNTCPDGGMILMNCFKCTPSHFSRDVKGFQWHGPVGKAKLVCLFDPHARMLLYIASCPPLLLLLLLLLSPADEQSKSSLPFSYPPRMITSNPSYLVHSHPTPHPSSPGLRMSARKGDWRVFGLRRGHPDVVDIHTVQR